MKSCWASLGENLIKANSAKEALEVLLKTDVAVVLMDVSMPDLDGFELAAMIRQHPRFQRTAIIFISAVHLTDLDRLKGYEHGAVDYISVPVVPELAASESSACSPIFTAKRANSEALNRELEQRVLERTEELEGKAELLQQLNSELVARIRNSTPSFTPRPTSFSAGRRTARSDYISDRFYEFTGAAAGSANGFGWLDYVHPEDKDKAMVDWLRCVESGANYEVEYRLRSSNGDYRWFRARAVPIRDDGVIAKWYGTCSDIHDSKLLEQSIRDNAAELEKMVDRRTDELRRLSVRLMTMQDQERRRIARDLHDGLGQELAVAKMVLDRMQLQKSGPPSPETWSQASDIVDRAIQQVRTMSHLLHPPLLDEVGLVSALSWYVEGLTKRSGIETSLEVQPRDFPRLASEVETAVFPHRARGADQRIPAFGGAQGLDRTESKGRNDCGFGSR